MQNVKTHIVIGATEGKVDKKTGKPARQIQVIYIGDSRHEAREVYLEGRGNLEFDFVGMDTLAGFKSRSRPKVEAEQSKNAAASMAHKTEQEVFEKARAADASKAALGEAALEAEKEHKVAKDKLASLISASGAEIVEDDGDYDEALDEEYDAALEDEEEELAAMIAAEEEADANADA